MIKNYKIRLEVFKNAKNHGFNFPVIVSPTSYLAKSALIKEGSIVMHGAIINANAKIGYNTIQVSSIGPINPKTVKKMCDDIDLIICATHEPNDEIINHTDKVIEKHLSCLSLL